MTRDARIRPDASVLRRRAEQEEALARRAILSGRNRSRDRHLERALVLRSVLESEADDRSHPPDPVRSSSGLGFSLVLHGALPALLLAGTRLILTGQGYRRLLPVTHRWTPDGGFASRLDLLPLALSLGSLVLSILLVILGLHRLVRHLRRRRSPGST